MIAKMTGENQLTLPKHALDAVRGVSQFEVAVDGDRLILTPARLSGGDAVRKKLSAIGITEADVAEAVDWARKPR